MQDGYVAVSSLLQNSKNGDSLLPYIKDEEERLLTVATSDQRESIKVS